MTPFSFTVTGLSPPPVSRPSISHRRIPRSAPINLVASWCIFALSCRSKWKFAHFTALGVTLFYITKLLLTTHRANSYLLHTDMDSWCDISDTCGVCVCQIHHHHIAHHYYYHHRAFSICDDSRVCLNMMANGMQKCMLTIEWEFSVCCFCGGYVLKCTH